MKSLNEWGNLKKVIVGRAEHATIPPMDVSLRTVNYADMDDVSNIKHGTYPQEVIEQAEEDLTTLSDFLQSVGVEVVRPDNTPTNYYNYCPRDLVLVHGNKAIATPMALQSRKNEFINISRHLENLYIPKNYQGDDVYNLNCVGNPDVLALHETHPKFDAANVIRANNDLLYLVSNSGNEVGAQLLQEYLGNDVKVHLLKNVYSYMHIDSTLAFLREGLLLANPSRIKSKDVLPKPFCDWDIIWCPEPTDIGHHPGYCNASKWINMNLISISENLVVVEENQISLKNELKKYGIKSAMLPMRQQRTLGGGFHCVTLDLVRE